MLNAAVECDAEQTTGARGTCIAIICVLSVTIGTICPTQTFSTHLITEHLCAISLRVSECAHIAAEATDAKAWLHGRGSETMTGRCMSAFATRILLDLHENGCE